MIRELQDIRGLPITENNDRNLVRGVESDLGEKAIDPAAVADVFVVFHLYMKAPCHAGSGSRISILYWAACLSGLDSGAGC